jgi:hypothetical protein
VKGGAAQSSFHYQRDVAAAAKQSIWRVPDALAYTFENFFHPYVGQLIRQLNRKPLGEFFDPAFLESLSDTLPAAYYTALGFQEEGAPAPDMKLTFFPKEIDVGRTSPSDGSGPSTGPYSNYNWELFFHIPLTIAVHLSKTQRFAEAQRWFHYIFDPTRTDGDGEGPARYWRFLRFRRESDPQQLDELLALLSKPDAECTPTEWNAKQEAIKGYDALMSRPFRPHLVARTRVVAYQYAVVMRYLDNLIAWGDSLFMQDTIESINEATQRYVLAANLLGARPEEVPPRGAVPPKTYADLKAKQLDVMGNAYVALEGQFPLNLGMPTQAAGGNGEALFGIGQTLYFCLPRNEKLLGYWDLVADRLFKIRHCMNIEGVVRPLALFDPPLDPGMLVKAVAAGLDIGSIVSGLNQPAGPVRCLFYIQKALELANEVRGLGNALLSVLEKGETERLTLLRQRHEINIQELSQEVRFLQWKQAEAATESLLRSRASALERYRYYASLLGVAVDANAVPGTFTADRRELTEESFDEAYDALVGLYDKTVPIQTYPPLALAGGSSPSNQSGASGQGNLHLSANEDADLNVHDPAARDYRYKATVLDTISAGLSLTPDMGIDMHYWGLGGHAVVFGGSLLASAGRFQSSLATMSALLEEGQAASAAKTAGYERRGYDWTLQLNLAGHELVQIGRQILASLIAEQSARREYLNTQAQIAQAREVDQYLHEKFTNEDLYGWMQGETARLYYEYYRFAVDTARKAEKTMKQELMRPEIDKTDFVQFNYWDGGRKGLLAGESLYLDVKRMELAYHENNKRELELTRHVSLRQLDPVALLQLKVAGKCEVTIPEWLYELDCPGHYMRRLKNVAVSLPSVVGPYTSLNCTLSLLRSSLRVSPLLDETSDTPHARAEDDTRFADYFGGVQSIVTSGGSRDSGTFETNLHEDRFLPFEGAGAISTWRLELPSDFRAFDYMTISDAVLHLRYTARDGGDLLGAASRSELRAALTQSNAGGLSWSLLLSLRHDFPTEWSGFANGDADLTLRIGKDYFPYMVQSETLAIDGLELYAPNEAGAKVLKRGIDVSPDLADALNGPSGSADVALVEDNNVLVRDPAANVFLVIRYSLST